jgi:hypothetical protein
LVSEQRLEAATEAVSQRNTIQLRGVYYHKVGRRAGVTATVARLLAHARQTMDARIAAAAAAADIASAGAGQVASGEGMDMIALA